MLNFVGTAEELVVVDGTEKAFAGLDIGNNHVRDPVGRSEGQGWLLAAIAYTKLSRDIIRRGLWSCCRIVCCCNM